MVCGEHQEDVRTPVHLYTAYQYTYIQHGTVYLYTLYAWMVVHTQDVACPHPEEHVAM